MINQSLLPDLLRRVKEATGPDRELGHDLVAALDLAPADMEYAGQAYDEYPGYWAGGGMEWEEPDLTVSLDAALGLCERVLPGALFAVCDLPQGNPAGKHLAGVRGDGLEEDGFGASRALALLAAMLTALIAKDSQP